MYVIKSITAALALATVFGAQEAEAATITPYTFTWSGVGPGTPYQSVVNFTLSGTQTAALSLSFYTGSGSDRTGYILLDGATRLTTASATACDSGGAPFAGGCSFIYSNTVDGTTLFAGLDAGEYTLGVLETAQPSSGTLEFDLTVEGIPSEVPLPAGGLLLIGALGGIAALRKRQKAA
ncbi:VPLPA-CTERM sorting domain-containing protein [Puniceibacterium sp. IMCC21224]|uniref:VPLPA-CTERM sorting domain-containing protein n=1 Tax=Puniceibacterium sp. IMCC21224 TaxID=1618204 RepID=UPI00065D8DDA|nr:VPLPA-CTERM sorting domain-containing protein [Puniceibacterium sp. IMCC21224]KMK63836.1 hypothetical protein IMCC21224_1823 [Puniceibacterium sp. IMCC21224]